MDTGIRHRKEGMSSSFVDSGTRRMFEDAGFRHERATREKNCVMTKTMAAA